MDTQYLSPKSDVIFKRIFGDEKNVDILSGLLKAVLNISDKELERITIVDPSFRKDHTDDKLSILDLKLKTASGISIDVEIQLLLNIPELKERIVYYISKMITEQLTSGVNYNNIKPVITIVIADFKFVNDSDAYHHVYRLYDSEEKSLFTDVVAIHTLELHKLSAIQEDGTLWEWMQFFKTQRKEDFEMLAEKNKEIGKAVAVLAELSQDEKTRLAYEYEEKARRDYVSRINGAKRDGILEVARRLKGNGIDTDIIIAATGLTEPEVNIL